MCNVNTWQNYWGRGESEEVTQYPVREVKSPLCFDLVCHQAGCRLSTFCLFTFLWSEEAKSGPGNCTPPNGQFWAWYWVGLVRKIFKPGQGTTSWYYISVAELILLPNCYHFEPVFCVQKLPLFNVFGEVKPKTIVALSYKWKNLCK